MTSTTKAVRTLALLSHSHSTHPLNHTPTLHRSLSTILASSCPSPPIRLVEVGPRDGLQNEKTIIPPSVKVELINRLGRAGMKTIEAGSFVSPKWVPQMAGTAEVITSMERLPGVRYPVLVPNSKGLHTLLELLSSHSSSNSPPPTDEIAIFTSATDAFSLSNTNCTVIQSLARLEEVARLALESGLRVRGYVSVVVVCPFSGRVDVRRVREVVKALVGMGCYEVSLGDTTGMGSPGTVVEMVNEVLREQGVRPEMLAGHFHDTYGTALSNIFASLSTGIRTFDTSISGLGGCPYSPGATGNVATEDVAFALRDSGLRIEGDPGLEELVDVGKWISERLGRENGSRAGKALRARASRMREEQVGKAGAGAGDRE